MVDMGFTKTEDPKDFPLVEGKFIKSDLQFQKCFFTLNKKYDKYLEKREYGVVGASKKKKVEDEDDDDDFDDFDEDDEEDGSSKKRTKIKNLDKRVKIEKSLTQGVFCTAAFIGMNKLKSDEVTPEGKPYQYYIGEYVEMFFDKFIWLLRGFN